MFWVELLYFIISSLFSWIYSPFSLIPLVMVLAGVVLYLMVLATSSYWMSLIFLLALLGGLMVLFIYLVSLFPEKGQVSVWGFHYLLIIPFLFMVLLFFSKVDGSSVVVLSSPIDMLKFFSLTLFLLFYLLLSLFSVVYISSVSAGPLKIYEINQSIFN